jgi:hypothetical protein
MPSNMASAANDNGLYNGITVNPYVGTNNPYVQTWNHSILPVDNEKFISTEDLVFISTEDGIFLATEG